MDVEEAIRTRRTVKAYEPLPVDRGTLGELLELARWAPNHNLTNPWRFRVVGPKALERLKGAAAEIAAAGAPRGCDRDEVGRAAAAKLERAPTLVVVSSKRAGDIVQQEEDMHATACAAYNVLLGAHARGLAGYWRTPGVLRTPEGRAAVGMAEEERFVGLLHLGEPVQERRPPERAPAEQVVEFLE